MIMARVESLIEKGMKDALKRAYDVEAGADGIMIHSKNNPKEIFEFSKFFEKI